jgi:hypothetical protein
MRNVLRGQSITGDTKKVDSNRKNCNFKQLTCTSFYTQIKLVCEKESLKRQSDGTSDVNGSANQFGSSIKKAPLTANATSRTVGGIEINAPTSC